MNCTEKEIDAIVARRFTKEQIEAIAKTFERTYNDEPEMFRRWLVVLTWATGPELMMLSAAMSTNQRYRKFFERLIDNGEGDNREMSRVREAMEAGK